MVRILITNGKSTSRLNWKLSFQLCSSLVGKQSFNELNYIIIVSLFLLFHIHKYLRQFCYSYWWRARHVGVYKPLFMTSKKCWNMGVTRELAPVLIRHFETSKSNSEVSKSNSSKITAFSKTTLLNEMEPFLTMFHTINLSPLLVNK